MDNYYEHEEKLIRIKKGDVVCDRNTGDWMLVCCDAACGSPMLAFNYSEDENSRGTSYKYIPDYRLEYIGRF